MNEQHLRQYAELFCHCRDIYAVQKPDGGYFLVREPVTDDLLRRHFEGKVTCGWYALQPGSTVAWVVLDADAANGLQMLVEVWQSLRELGLAAYLENSRRGGHLWLFLEPMQAVIPRTLVQHLLVRLELEGIEVYPKQDELAEVGVGSLVRGPLGVHRLTKQRYSFLDPVLLKPVGKTLSEQMDFLMHVQVNPIHQVAEALARLVRQPWHPDPEPSSGNGNTAGRDKIVELKAAIGDLYTFVSQFAELDAKGRGPCPFHPPDERPSFVVNREKGYWVCFHEVNQETGRYLGGDAIEFYRRLKGLGFKEAVRELSAQYGVADLPF